MLRNALKTILKKNTPRWLVLVFDVYIVLNTFLLAYFIRFNFTLNFNFSEFLGQIPVVIIATIFIFLVTGSYKGIIRHTGVRDAFSIFVSSSLIAAILGFMVFLSRFYIAATAFKIPLSIIAIHFLLNLFFLIASRFVFKTLYIELFSNSAIEENVLIYGAGEMGLITNSVLSRDSNNLNTMGFIDDDRKKCNKHINGFKVYHASEINDAFIRRKNITQIIIAIQKIKPSRIQEILKDLAKLSVEIKIIPPVKEWINSNLKGNKIRQIKIEDLLGRDVIEFNNPKLKQELVDKVIFITGAAGSIGAELARQLAEFKYGKLVLIDQAESDLFDLQQYFNHKNKERIVSIVADIKDKKRMNAIFKKYNPNYIFHAAAYKHVPFMEENPYEAVKTNIGGTKVIADLALKYFAEKFIMISTDKAVNPTNVMGATKRIAELYINCVMNTTQTKFIITRFGNVMGSNGSVIPLLKKQLEQGGPLTVTHKEITRYFMTITEACQLVLEAVSMGNGGEIFVFEMGESVKIFELAKNLIHLSGLKYPEDIDIKIIGLRPGEKIYEELLANGEDVLPTYHEKIMIAKSNVLAIESTYKKIEELLLNNNPKHFENAVYLMKELVPEFISNNSEYEKLDKKFVN